MHEAGGKLLFSATDLSNFLACEHLSLLDRRAAQGGPKPPVYDNPSLDVLWQRGLEHEQQYLAKRKGSAALHVIEIEPSPGRWELDAQRTIDAMKSGADLIYQGVLFDGTWLGKPDFLEKVDKPSGLGDWSYEIVDTKLAREAKGGALLQLLLYADLLAKVQGKAPEHVHLGLGGPEAKTHTFRVADYAAYFRSVRKRFVDQLASAPEQLPTVVDPVAHCDICAWAPICNKARRDADHLSLVAGITRIQRKALSDSGISTLESLATLQADTKPKLERVGTAAFARIYNQAGIQLEGRRAQTPKHELLHPIEPNQGLAALPTPSPGDLFFDLEGDPYALTWGIEYLFGFVDREGNYTGWWSLDAREEKRTFECFMDFVKDRLQRYPDLHIYHFAPYEPTNLKRLMGRYSTREDELDRLLRGRVLVDLHRVVRNALRASVESYSIKKLEAHYGFTRTVDLRSASSALAHFEAWLELGPTSGDHNALLRDIEGYNKDDCLSTLALRDWLETQRDDVARETGIEVPRPVQEEDEVSQEATEKQQAIDELVAQLTAGVPEERVQRTDEQHAAWLMAQLLEFHRREKKSMWWEYFRCLALSSAELIEDSATLGGLEYEGVVGQVKKSNVHRYRFPPQEHGFKPGDQVIDPATKKKLGKIHALDDLARTVDLTRGVRAEIIHPAALIADEFVSSELQQASLMRTGAALAQHRFADTNPVRSAADLLLRHPPRVGQQPGAPITRVGEGTLDAAVRLSAALDRSVLPIQGPPGAGKTYTGARMIVNALAAGKRVGITATSHRVISNLLDAVADAAEGKGITLRAIQKADNTQRCNAAQINNTDDPKEVVQAVEDRAVDLVAGTAWLWSRDDVAGSMDLLFIDEAGQFSLADAIAVAPAAASLVLLGDPQQLDQPQQGVHPPGADLSVLDHLLSGVATVTPDRGLFLDQTWRLHPEICAFTSELFYEDRLQSRPGLEKQTVQSASTPNGSGLRLFAIEHTGNQNESVEEVAAVAALVEALTNSAAWTNSRGEEQPLTIEDILVVAPYNAQVSEIAERLPPSARVGTVDKFQGQEAPIVIYSMATSSPEEAPRGMAFLYSPNRLNVATSRAQCLAIVVANPSLFAPSCRTPEQMRLANAFCRFRELARDEVGRVEAGR